MVLDARPAGVRLGIACTVFALCFAGMAAAASQATKKAGATKAPTSAASETPKFKAIWEPVNVKEDLHLLSVRFTSADEGWVAGGRQAIGGGVILHTKDGGANWEIQVGDPQSNDRSYGDLRFVGPKLGFAVQSTGAGDHLLLRTTDGQNWTSSGTVGQHRGDYQFTSADTGFYVSGTNIFRTTNAGRQWQQVYQCRVKAEVNGLTRDVACEFEAMNFVNVSLGYAISQGIGGGVGFVLAKTEDGGTTWTPWLILPGEDGKEGALHFFDANTGVLRTVNGKLFRTSDGGRAWQGVPGQADGKPDMEFVDPQVGWMMRYSNMTYTTDGGNRWVSRSIAFPAKVEACSLVSRDRGYAVGEHGMVYKYRIVPIDYMSKGMLPAPAMPAK
jgi:photosystem II stability/assembly factor-like uncharacterized protein